MAGGVVERSLSGVGVGRVVFRDRFHPGTGGGGGGCGAAGCGGPGAATCTGQRGGRRPTA